MLQTRGRSTGEGVPENSLSERKQLLIQPNKGCLDQSHQLLLMSDIGSGQCFLTLAFPSTYGLLSGGGGHAHASFLVSTAVPHCVPPLLLGSYSCRAQTKAARWWEVSELDSSGLPHSASQWNARVGKSLFVRQPSMSEGRPTPWSYLTDDREWMFLGWGVGKGEQR